MIADFGLFADNRELYERDQAALEALRYIWNNAGKLPTGSKVSLESTLRKDKEHTDSIRQLLMDSGSPTDLPWLTSRIIAEIAIEAVEPTAVLEPFFETIKLSQPGGTLIIPSWGAMHAADIPFGGEYPERSIEIAGYIKATIGKVGLKIPFSDEMIKFSEFDVMGAHTRAAGAALKRAKEKKLADAIRKYGTVLFDNDDTSVISTSGRNAVGARNGTITLEDFFAAHQIMTDNGFQPNTLIIHPNAWLVFAVESIARLFGLQRGASWKADTNPDYRGTNLGRQAVVPATFPTDWNIVVSPYIYYDSTTGSEWPLTDIIMCDANGMGVIVDNGGGVQTNDFREPLKDIRNVTLKEEYGVSITNDGKAIGLIKNVSVGRGIDFWENTVQTLTGATFDTSLTGDVDFKGSTTGTK